jgi:hypothetical protein
LGWHDAAQTFDDDVHLLPDYCEECGAWCSQNNDIGAVPVSVDTRLQALDHNALHCAEAQSQHPALAGSRLEVVLHVNENAGVVHHYLRVCAGLPQYCD